MEDIEIEIQAKIEHSKPLTEFLKQHATFKHKTHQRDEYFTPAHRDFRLARPLKEWFRVRNEDGKCSINYKHWYYDGKGRSNHCNEIELTIGDEGKMRKMLNALNFISLTIVEKVRTSWDYQEWEISMDQVQGLGDFVEIEYKGKVHVDPERVTEEMTTFLKRVGCGKISRNYVGYPFQLMFPDEVVWDER